MLRMKGRDFKLRVLGSQGVGRRVSVEVVFPGWGLGLYPQL